MRSNYIFQNKKQCEKSDIISHFESVINFLILHSSGCDIIYHIVLGNATVSFEVRIKRQITLWYPCKTSFNSWIYRKGLGYFGRSWITAVLQEEDAIEGVENPCSTKNSSIGLLHERKIHCSYVNPLRLGFYILEKLELPCPEQKSTENTNVDLEKHYFLMIFIQKSVIFIPKNYTHQNLENKK